MGKQTDAREYKMEVSSAQFVEGAGVALMMIDRDLRVASFNTRVAQLLARVHAGALLTDCAAGYNGHEFEQVVRSVITDGVPAEFELRRPAGDGTAPQLHSASVWPIHDDAGEPCGAGVALFDIAARVEQLGRGRKMQALAIMAGKIAHHFNNILGGVVTRVDFARSSSDPRVLRRCLDSTAAGLQRATTLLDGLLAFAEADYRDADLADLKETVINYVERLQHEIQGRNIELHVRLADIPVVAVPRNQFDMVLDNIVRNALDALRDGGRLSVELQRNDDRVICVIADSGAGISEQDFEHVFEPFFSTKGHNVTEESAQHPGLGLSVALGIVHEMGGEITLDSKPGQPTVVAINLPVDGVSTAARNEMVMTRRC